MLGSGGMCPLASAHLPCQLSNAWDLLSVFPGKEGVLGTYHLLDWPVSSEPSIHHLKVRVVPAAALAIQGEENTYYIWEHSNSQPGLSARGFPMREVIARGMTPFLGSLVPVWEILDHVSMR